VSSWFGLMRFQYLQQRVRGIEGMQWRPNRILGIRYE
jgi:hypothetical protein